MLERALTQPQQCSVDPLSNAHNWGIPIWSTFQLQAWLEKITASLKDSNTLKRDNRAGSGKEVKVKHLKEPYIKFEPYDGRGRPIFIELQSWPTLNFDGDPGTSPFELKKREKKENILTKDIKENREKYCNTKISKGKDMTRRPRATATRARKTENTGYCEICRVDYGNLSKHLQSDQHLNFIRDDKNFISLDNLISTGASVEAFLKINRPKDGKDSLFSSRDHSLDNGILSSDEKSEKRDKMSLDDYSIDEEMKLVQCNGARRNLNSKLDSPHNLRTRTKHESGHSLRSKGKAEDEVETKEKSSERYTVKKRAKGTIWIEEDSEDDKNDEKEHVDFNGRPLHDAMGNSESKKKDGDCTSENVSMNGDISPGTVCKRRDSPNKHALKESFLETNLKTKINGYERKEERQKLKEAVHNAENHEAKEIKQEIITEVSHVNVDNSDCEVLLPINDNEDTNSIKSMCKDDKGKNKPRRGARSIRGRHRLSVEERLIEDNRDYYKVEVLGNKLRSSAIPMSGIVVTPSKEQTDNRSPKKDDKPSSEKPVVVRFKRVRKSELSLLSDEAESFMFGEPRRDDSSSESEIEQSSVLPKDTESEREETLESFAISSSPETKREANEDEPNDSITAGRAKKRRRTQTEALLKDNTDYYKFETPGSRLRFQAPLTGISDTQPLQPLESNNIQVAEKIYPSKPSPEVEKMHFSFEAVPKSEPWYQTYQRQDEGEEYYYFSEMDRKPFLLPYEIENFHEILQKSIQSSSVHRKRGRRGGHVNMGCRSPRKSPRCHASTLAIMSTIIRRREQQTTNLSPVEEEPSSKPASEITAKPEKKVSEKSDVDEDLKEIVKNLDEMLSGSEEPEMDSFEVDLLKNDDVVEPSIEPTGAPANLLELLDNCRDVPPNGIENSSCASSECGETNPEFPLRKRKKKRKNKTGWPGNKMRRKLHIKHLSEEIQKELEKDLEKKCEDNNRTKVDEPIDQVEEDSSHALLDEENETENETGNELGRKIFAGKVQTKAKGHNVFGGVANYRTRRQAAAQQQQQQRRRLVAAKKAERLEREQRKSRAAVSRRSNSQKGPEEAKKRKSELLGQQKVFFISKRKKKEVKKVSFLGVAKRRSRLVRRRSKTFEHRFSARRQGHEDRRSGRHGQ